MRENRTYDQVFGDVAAGNGDARFCLFPENVTPNAHALASTFVLLDNFYADGEVSADGHEWTMAGYATDFVEKGWPLNYGHNAEKKYDYPSEGRYPIAYPANGYLWNRASEAGVSFRTYGEFTQDGGGTREEPGGLVDELYPSWDITITDVRRAESLRGCASRPMSAKATCRTCKSCNSPAITLPEARPASAPRLPWWRTTIWRSVASSKP